MMPVAAPPSRMTVTVAWGRQCCPDLMLVCGGWLGLRLAASGRAVVLRLPTSGREVGWRVPTCSDYERRIFFVPLVFCTSPA